jgi:hypothetical protein
MASVFRSQGLSVKDFEGPRFQRIAHVRWLLANGLLSEDLRLREGVVN